VEALSAVVDRIAKERPHVCLALDGGDDLQQALMSSIRPRHPHVFAASACEPLPQMLYRTPDGRKAVRIEIYGWRRTSPWHARIEFYYDTNFMFGSASSTFHLRLEGGKWKVAGESIHSIS
jgi:hypothetical protein